MSHLPMPLAAWLEHVRDHGVKMGLTRARRALEVLGEPQRRYPSILVGGTNGKGSTVSFAEALLAAAGLKVGSTISPHLTEYRERFRFAGRPVSLDRLEAHADGVARLLAPHRDLDELTFFELGASLALSLFAEEAVDAAVVEVGMGGELDATRCCEPAVSAIVSVDEDHLHFLGPTIADVARTKARIAPPGGVLVCAEPREDRVAIIAEETRAAGAELWLIGRDFNWQRGSRGFSFRAPGLELEDVQLGLSGLHQGQNAACALACVVALHRLRGTPLPDAAATRAALLDARIPGRMEAFAAAAGPRWLFDGAHNPAGVEQLARELAARPRPRRRVWLLASMTDKRHDQMVPHLVPHVDAILCTRGLTSDRFATPDQLAELVSGYVSADADVDTAASPAEAVARLTAALDPQDEVLVAGSLYLVGDVRPLVGLEVGVHADHRGRLDA